MAKIIRLLNHARVSSGISYPWLPLGERCGCCAALAWGALVFFAVWLPLAIAQSAAQTPDEPVLAQSVPQLVAAEPNAPASPPAGTAYPDTGAEPRSDTASSTAPDSTDSIASAGGGAGSAEADRDPTGALGGETPQKGIAFVWALIKDNPAWAVAITAVVLLLVSALRPRPWPWLQARFKNHHGGNPNGPASTEATKVALTNASQADCAAAGLADASNKLRRIPGLRWSILLLVATLLFIGWPQWPESNALFSLLSTHIPDWINWVIFIALVVSLVVLAIATIDAYLDPDATDNGQEDLERKRRRYWLAVILISSLVLVGAVILSVADNGLLITAKAALQDKPSQFLFLVLAMVGIYPLTYLAYHAFGQSTHRERLENDFKLLGLVKPDDAKHTVNQLYSTVYSGIQFSIFIGLIVLISVLVLYAFYVYFFLGNPRELSLTPNQVYTVFFAYLGAYVFSVQELVRRYNTYDLQPQVYAAIAVRMLIAIGIVVVAQKAFDSQNDDSLALWSAVAFLIGFFPTQGLQYLSNAASKVFAQSSQDNKLLPLARITGISTWHESRLLQMGIDDAQNLATADLRRLLLTTQFDAEQIVNWVDQAILHVKLQDKIESFQKERILGNYQFVRLLGQLDSCPRSAGDGAKKPDSEDVKGLMAAIGARDRHALYRLKDDASFANAEHIRAYYQNVPKKIRRYAEQGLSDTTGGGDSGLLVDVLRPGRGRSSKVPDAGERQALETLRIETIQQLRTDPDDANLLNRLGAVLLRLGKDDEAIQEFDKAIAEAPEEATAYANRGLARARSDEVDFASAIKDLSRAARLSGGDARIYISRGAVRLESGDVNGALDDFNNALERNSRLAQGYLHRALAYQRGGESGAALQDFDRAALLGADSPELYLAWGLTLAEGTDEQSRTKAVEKLTAAIDLDPCSAVFYVERGFCYLPSPLCQSATSDERQAFDARLEYAKRDFLSAQRCFKASGTNGLGAEGLTRLISLGLVLGERMLSLDGEWRLAEEWFGQQWFVDQASVDATAYAAKLALAAIHQARGETDAACRLFKEIDAASGGFTTPELQQLAARASRAISSLSCD